MARKPIVAIDGPAGAGKSTVSMRLARTLGFSLIDTGAIYRTVALAATRRKVSLDDDHRLGELVGTLRIEFRFDKDGNRTYLDGEDVSTAIRTPEISMAASSVSARKVVRDGLLGLQRRLGQVGGVVLEGRDIGTVVFPDAEVKIFLTASERERARRRNAELRQKGTDVGLEETIREVRERDRQDSTREHAPLCKAADATEIVTDGLSIEEVVAQIAEMVRRRAASA
jgi:cytidylate kinase